MNCLTTASVSALVLLLLVVQVAVLAVDEATSSRAEGAQSCNDPSSALSVIRDAIFRYATGEDASYRRNIVLSGALDMSFVEFGTALRSVASREDLGPPIEDRLRDLPGGDFAARAADALRGDGSDGGGATYSEATRNFFHALRQLDPVLSEEDMERWEESGYVVAHQVADPEVCRAAVKGIYESFGAKEDEPESWYAIPEARSHSDVHGFVTSAEYENEHMREIRFSPRVFKAFSQLWGTEDLWSNKMWAAFSPPAQEEEKETASGNLHWDGSLKLPIPFHTSAVVYLTDHSAEKSGGTQLVPGMHKTLMRWLSQQLDARTARRLAPAAFQKDAVIIRASACDMVIYRQEILHGTLPNHSTTPELSLYLNMMPPDAKIQPFE